MLTSLGERVPTGPTGRWVDGWTGPRVHVRAGASWRELMRVRAGRRGQARAGEGGQARAGTGGRAQALAVARKAVARHAVARHAVARHAVGGGRRLAIQ